MPIGPFEQKILRILADNRSPESFVAGATVLNQSPQSPRASEDIDLFHDSEEILQASVEQDEKVLRGHGYEMQTIFSRPNFHRARVLKGDKGTKMEWVHDSAFRFFPVEKDPLLGYRLSIWDAATNKVLAGVGRGVVRDYVDLLHLHETRLSLGALIWAAAGKDPGLSPDFMRAELMRTHHYDAETYASLRASKPLDPVALKQTWIRAMGQAKALFDFLVEREAPYGCFFLGGDGKPQAPSPDTLEDLRPHHGSLRGCWPRIVGE